MSHLKKIGLFGMTTLLLVACGTGNDTDSTGDNENTYSIAMVTDTGGVDDRSFNQSAWEGMQEWAEEHNYEDEQVIYYQSDSESDYKSNIDNAVIDEHDIIYGVGYLLEDPIEEAALQNPDQKFGIVDAEIDEDNVVSMGFADHEAAFLAGVVAAKTTETDRLGFVGGFEGIIVDRFHTGFLDGVEYVDENIDVDIQYVDSFSDAGAGQQTASAMFSNDVDIIFHASGAAGNGVFQEARNRMEEDPSEDLWVIGVDSDQEEEGNWEGGNLTLTSTLKEVGQAIKLTADEDLDDNFQGGRHVQYDLEDGGVNITRGNISDDVWKETEEVKQLIIDGEIEVKEFTYSNVDD